MSTTARLPSIWPVGIKYSSLTLLTTCPTTTIWTICKQHTSIVLFLSYHLRRICDVRQQLGRDVIARLVTVLVLSCLDYCNAVLACTQRHAPFWIWSRAIVWLQLFKSCTGCQSLRGSSTSCARWFTSRFWDGHRPEYISDLLTSVASIPSRSTLRASSCVATSSCRGHVDESATKPFCCCTASMEQVANGAETAAIDGLVKSSWSENISVSFCLRAPGYGLTLWCALGLLVGAQYKCFSYS